MTCNDILVCCNLLAVERVDARRRKAGMGGSFNPDIRLPDPDARRALVPLSAGFLAEPCVQHQRAQSLFPQKVAFTPCASMQVHGAQSGSEYFGSAPSKHLATYSFCIGLQCSTKLLGTLRNGLLVMKFCNNDFPSQFLFTFVVQRKYFSYC